MQFEKFGPVDMNNQASPYSELRVRKGLAPAVRCTAPGWPFRTLSRHLPHCTRMTVEGQKQTSSLTSSHGSFVPGAENTKVRQERKLPKFDNV